MISDIPQWDNTPDAALPDGRVVNLRQTFGKSGLYDATTLAPRWQVEWFAFKWHLLCSDDCRHVARLNIHGVRSDWAIAFYDQGKLIRKYDCPTLLTRMKSPRCLPFQTGDWHYQWYGRFRLSSGGDRVLLSTVRRQAFIAGRNVDLGFQEFYELDLATGEILSRRTSGGWVVWAYAAEVLAVSALLAGVAYAFAGCGNGGARPVDVADSPSPWL